MASEENITGVMYGNSRGQSTIRTEAKTPTTYSVGRKTNGELCLVGGFIWTERRPNNVGWSEFTGIEYRELPIMESGTFKELETNKEKTKWQKLLSLFGISFFTK